MKFDPEKIRKAAKEDFDTTWNQGNNYLAQPTIQAQYPRFKQSFGKPHPIYDTIQKLRDAYLRLGFEEAVNPLIIDEREVHKQFGYEALAVLDRCFYLAGLPRPNVGISDEQITRIKEILSVDEAGIEIIRQILHAYKKGEIEGDDLVPELSHRLDVPDTLVAKMLDRIFPEFKELTPIGSNKTLRSHMTSGWFITLGALIERARLPINLFSIDRCFRREQQEDATRLMTYFSASCVIMDPDVTVEHGKAIAAGLLSQFGFEQFSFRPDEKRSKYYIPDTQIEVFAYHPGLVGSNTKYSDGWVEVATFGIYSPTALAQYGIPYPVMNLGLGVERMAMILHNSNDVRALTYPQFPVYEDKWNLPAEELAGMITVERSPVSKVGWDIQKAIVGVCEQHGSEPSPCEFLAWSGMLNDREIEVRVVEPEENTRLCGPAAMNSILVVDGDILGLPDSPKYEKKFNKGTRVNLRYIDAFAALCAAQIEEASKKGETSSTRVRIVKVPSEVNISLDPIALRYITSLNKKIDVRGPVFTTVTSELV
ncbi:MAG: O-phosphoseryl-tRNA synthetase [Candidatus Methanomarinus sp.]|jgi:O-phosphoseryl-tRNA synthetase|nr:MAG: O-phosphoseryl-tRNA synthetase [ANME-2 cluster archaeon]